jgi:hypothetical protein
MTHRNSAFVEVDEDRKTDEGVEVEFAEIAGGGVDEEDGSSTWRPLCSLPGHQTLQWQQILLAGTSGDSSDHVHAPRLVMSRWLWFWRKADEDWIWSWED